MFPRACILVACLFLLASLKKLTFNLTVSYRDLHSTPDLTMLEALKNVVVVGGSYVGRVRHLILICSMLCCCNQLSWCVHTNTIL